MAGKRNHVLVAIGIILLYFVAALALAGICWLAYDLRESRAREANLLARSAVNDLWVSFVETETSQRGYMLTANIYDLDLYYISLTHIEESRSRLAPYERLMSAENKETMKEIEDMMDHRLGQMKSTIKAFHEKGPPSALAIVIRNQAGVRETLRIRELKNRVEESLVPGLKSP